MCRVGGYLLCVGWTFAVCRVGICCGVGGHVQGGHLLCAGWVGICCVQGRWVFAVCRVDICCVHGGHLLWGGWACAGWAFTVGWVGGYLLCAG